MSEIIKSSGSVKTYDIIEINKKTFHCRKEKIFENNGKLCGFIKGKDVIIYKKNICDIVESIEKINEKYTNSRQSILNKNKNLI